MSIDIRHTEKEDYEGIRDLYAQPSCFAGTLQLPLPSKDMWQARLGNTQNNHYSFVAIHNHKIIGELGLQTQTNPRRKHVATMGIGVSEECRKQGVGSQLLAAAIDMTDNWLAIKRIELQVYTDNHAAQALYKKYGFAIEGTAKSYAFRNGQYVDVYLMARVL